MNTRSLFIASGIAGIAMALLSNLPVIYLGNCLACLWLWSGGILGAWIYRRSENSITTGQGAVIGLVGGLIGAVLGAILGTIFGGVGLASLLSSQTGSAEELAGSFGFAGMMSVIYLLFNIFIYPIFGAIGGAIGSIIFASK